MLENLSFSGRQIDQAALLLIGKLIHPASELDTASWGKNVSALGELIGVDFSHLSNNALYRVSDLLLLYRDAIEKNLAGMERDILNLSEKIILYNLHVRVSGVS